MIDLPKDELVQVPCEQCGSPKYVNKVYLPYLDGKVRCFDRDCPLKNDKNL